MHTSRAILLLFIAVLALQFCVTFVNAQSSQDKYFSDEGYDEDEEDGNDEATSTDNTKEGDNSGSSTQKFSVNPSPAYSKSTTSQYEGIGFNDYVPRSSAIRLKSSSLDDNSTYLGPKQDGYPDIRNGIYDIPNPDDELSVFYAKVHLNYKGDNDDTNTTDSETTTKERKARKQPSADYYESDEAFDGTYFPGSSTYTDGISMDDNSTDSTYENASDDTKETTKNEKKKKKEDTSNTSSSDQASNDDSSDQTSSDGSDNTNNSKRDDEESGFYHPVLGRRLTKREEQQHQEELDEHHAALVDLVMPDHYKFVRRAAVPDDFHPMHHNPLADRSDELFIHHSVPDHLVIRDKPKRDSKQQFGRYLNRRDSYSPAPEDDEEEYEKAMDEVLKHSIHPSVRDYYEFAELLGNSM